MLLLPLAEGVCVNLRGGGDGRVAEAFADGRQVHAFLQQEARVAVADRVEACALGKLQRPAKPGDRSRLLQKHTAPDYSTRK